MQIREIKSLISLINKIGYRVAWNLYMPRFQLKEGKADIKTSEGYYLQTFLGLTSSHQYLVSSLSIIIKYHHLVLSFSIII